MAVRDRSRNLIGSLVTPLVAFRTYKRLGYLLLLFPLGVAMFTLWVTVGAVAFGFAASIVLLPVALIFLAFVPYLSLAVTAGQRKLAELLLGVEYDWPTIPRDGSPLDATKAWIDGEGSARDVVDAIRTNYRAVLTLGRTWTGLVHHLLQFVAGIVALAGLSFVFTNVVLLVLLPWTYETGLIAIHVPETITLSPSVGYDAGQWDVELTLPVTISSWVVDSMTDAVLLSGLGVVLSIVSLYLTNLVGWLYGRYVALLLR